MVRLIRRTLTGLVTRILNLILAAALLGFVVASFVHLTNGFSFRASLGAGFQDARLALTCPSNWQRNWDFIDRSQADQIALGRSLTSGDHGYSDICSADRFPLEDWPVVQPEVLAPAVPSPGSALTNEGTQLPDHPTVPNNEVPLSLSSDPPSELKIFMLGLINDDRQANGLGPVSLGDNPAAQKHAEEMLTNSYLSHWSMDGMKPYMRHTLAGGVNYVAENVAGAPSPPIPRWRYRTVLPKDELQELQQGLMESPGHRRNILDPLHQKVSLGIACDRITCSVSQQFSADYVEFSEKPAIVNGILSLAGNLAGDLEFVNIQVWYDPPPRPLTFGQLDKTHCYDTGILPVAFIRKPLPPGTSYVPSPKPYTWDLCTNPYDVPPDTPRLQSGSISPDTTLAKSTEAPSLTARTWEATGGSFRVEADLSRAIANHGDGVYTVLVWGDSSGGPVTLTTYAVFVE